MTQGGQLPSTCPPCLDSPSACPHHHRHHYYEVGFAQDDSGDPRYRPAHN